MTDEVYSISRSTLEARAHEAALRLFPGNDDADQIRRRNLVREAILTAVNAPEIRVSMERKGGFVYVWTSSPEANAQADALLVAAYDAAKQASYWSQDFILPLGGRGMRMYFGEGTSLSSGILAEATRGYAAIESALTRAGAVVVAGTFLATGAKRRVESRRAR